MHLKANSTRVRFFTLQRLAHTETHLERIFLEIKDELDQPVGPGHVPVVARSISDAKWKDIAIRHTGRDRDLS